MTGKIFISYRRDDSAGHAGRVHDRLEKEFGRDLLFMDVDAIPLGADFIEVLRTEVAKCDVLLAIIGPHWVDARDENGNRRLDSEHDFVRVEIAAALARSIPVIPILLENTRVPKAEQLPDDLKGLVRRNGLDVRHASFHIDMDKLIRGLRPSTPVPPSAPAPTNEERYRAEGRIKVEAKIIHGAPDGWFKPGNGKTEWFKDIDIGPEMVVVPAGEFTMGSNDDDFQKPPHKVTIKAPFAAGRFAVTFAEWDAAGLAHKPRDEGWGRGRRPVIYVSWEDAKSYAAWLSQKTGKEYRLLSEAEWEYCCRAGTTTKYAFGDSITRQQAQFSEGVWGSAKQTVEVGKFPPNAWGLYDTHGNVWEWCEDNWHADYTGAPQDGSVWQGGDISLRVLRGGCLVQQLSSPPLGPPQQGPTPATATATSASVFPERSNLLRSNLIELQGRVAGGFLCAEERMQQAPTFCRDRALSAIIPCPTAPTIPRKLTCSLARGTCSPRCQRRVRVRCPSRRIRYQASPPDIVCWAKGSYGWGRGATTRAWRQPACACCDVCCTDFHCCEFTPATATRGRALRRDNPMHFHVGQKVVCINDRPRPGQRWGNGHENCVKAGEIYTVREIVLRDPPRLQ